MTLKLKKKIKKCKTIKIKLEEHDLIISKADKSNSVNIIKNKNI